MMVRVFANDPEEMGSIPGGVIPKTQKMVLDASSLNTQQYNVGIKGKVKQSLLLLPGLVWLEIVILIRDQSMNETNIFKNYSCYIRILETKQLRENISISE